MNITATMVKELREKTGAGMMDAKKALVEVDGDMEKAMELLRQKGIASADKKMGRIAAEGRIGSYIGESCGAMIEVNCETDFVAKGEAFNSLVRDIAMQIAAAKPEVVNIEDVDPRNLEKERVILIEQAKNKNSCLNIFLSLNPIKSAKNQSTAHINNNSKTYLGSPQE